MKKIIFLFAIAVIYVSFSSCNNSHASGLGQPSVKSTQELRQELAAREELNPTAMLVGSGTMRQNTVMVQKQFFFRSAVYQNDGEIINGFIRSKASVARFKDAQVRVTFYSETQTELNSVDTTLYKYFNPNSTIPFEMKVYPPAETKIFTIQVINATALN
jgi:hypothetical protein